MNGKLVSDDVLLNNSTIHLIPRLNGGKGGFGSMLRAIGAQIEKTTNREACRDLSGRRLRDINEEQRLKNWIAAQAEREKEASDRKQKKLERLCQLPKHEFKDDQYDKERSELPEKVVDAVEQGLKVAAGSSNGGKRKNADGDLKKKKKAKLWVDADVEDELSSTDEESESEVTGGSSLEQNSEEKAVSSDSNDVTSQAEKREDEEKHTENAKNNQEHVEKKKRQ